MDLSSLPVLSSAGGGSASTSTRVAVLAASVTVVVGLLTVLANLWIARAQRRLSARQPLFEQSALAAQARDGRIRVLIETSEQIRGRCWEISRSCRATDVGVADLADQFTRHTDAAREAAEGLQSGWAPLRPDVSDAEYDRLLSRRISCMEALDSLTTLIAVRIRLLPLRLHEIAGAVEAVDRSAGEFVADLVTVRRSWARDSGIELESKC